MKQIIIGLLLIGAIGWFIINLADEICYDMETRGYNRVSDVELKQHYRRKRNVLLVLITVLIAFLVWL